MKAEAPDTKTIELVEEQLDVRRVARPVEHAHVTTHVQVVPTQVAVPVVTEHIAITRVPKNLEVSGPMPVRQEGDVTIISLVEEVAVVTIKFVLKEEVRITKQKLESTKTVAVDLRREYADIERDAAK